MKELFDDDMDVTVTLSLDDGSEIECRTVTVFQAGGRDYIALLPLEGPEAETGNVWIYRYREMPGGEPELENIEDDQEFELARDAFDEFLDTVEFDELVEEDEDAPKAEPLADPEETEDHR